MTYNRFMPQDPAPLLRRGADRIAQASDIRPPVPPEIWRNVATHCDHETVDAFERAMFPAGGQPLLWDHLARPFFSAIGAGALVRPTPAFGRLCRRGLPQQTLEALSVRDTERVAKSLLPGCKTSFLYLQVASEKHRRQLAVFDEAVTVFIDKTTPCHSGGESRNLPLGVLQKFSVALAAYTTWATQLKEDDNAPDWQLRNGEFLIIQLSAAMDVVNAFRAYIGPIRIGERWIGVGADKNFRSLKVAAKRFRELVQEPQLSAHAS